MSASFNQNFYQEVPTPRADPAFLAVLAVAKDLAEEYIAGNRTHKAAAGIRRVADEGGPGALSREVQEYLEARDAICGAMWALLDGRDGFRLVPLTDDLLRAAL